MLVKNNKAVAYLHNEILWNPGEVIEVNEADAGALLKDGFELVADEPKSIKGEEQ